MTTAVRLLALPASVLALVLLATMLLPLVQAGIGAWAGGPVLSGIGAVLAAATWLSCAWLLSRVLDVLFARAGRGGRQPTFPRLLIDLARGLLFGLAVLGIVSTVFGRSATGLVATSGVLIAVLGFALRNIIGDIFSGIALNVEHPYRLGDWIETAPGTAGKVVEINWRATRLITREGTSVVVPNGLIAGGRLVNFSQPEPSYRTSVQVCLDAEVPVARAKRVLLSAALCTEGVLAEPRPDVLVESLPDRGVTYAVRFWVPDYGREALCRDAVLATILDHLERAGIAMALPKHAIARLGPHSRGDEADGSGRKLLGRVDLFSAFAPEELDELAGLMRCRRVAEGKAVVRQSEPGSSLFLIGEGALDVRIALDDRRSVLVDRLRPGDIFGEMSLLTGQARSASVIAATEAVVYEIDQTHLDPLLRRRPVLVESLAELMAARQKHNRARTEVELAALDAPRQTTAQDILARLRGFFKLSA